MVLRNGKKMNKALILGVGSAQVDAIRYLKRQNWWVIGCSYRREGAALTLVDQFVLLDIADSDALANFAQQQEVQLVYSVGSDLAVLSIAQINQLLGFKNLVSPALADQVSSKIALRRFLDRAGLSPVCWQPLSASFTAESWSRFPAFVKPDRSQGQRGIVYVGNRPDLERTLATIAPNSERPFLIEEALPGREISVNVLVTDGKVSFQAVSQRLSLAGFDCGIPHAHVLSDTVVTTDEQSMLSELIQGVVTALAMENGPIYFQLKMTADGPKIIEFSPRLDGCHLWRLINHSCGVDLLDAVFSLMNGQVSMLPQVPVYQPCTLEFFFERPGTQFDRSRHPFPIDTLYGEYYYQSGELVRPINGHMEKVGYVIREGIPRKFSEV